MSSTPASLSPPSPSPPWPPTTHSLLAIQIACRQLSIRVPLDDMDLQRVINDMKAAPPIPAPAAQDGRYLAFTAYIVGRHGWIDGWIDVWLADYWWAWGLLHGKLAAPNAYVEWDAVSGNERSRSGSICSGLGMWM